MWATKEAIKKEITIAVNIEGKSDEEKLSNALQQFKEQVVQDKNKIAQRIQEDGGFVQNTLNLIGLSSLTKEGTGRLDALNIEIQSLNKKSLQSFKKIEEELKSKQLPDEILQRHSEAVKTYEAEYQKMQSSLQQLNEAQNLHDQEVAIEALDAFMEKQQFKRSHQFTDPNNLPFGTPDPKKLVHPLRMQNN